MRNLSKSTRFKVTSAAARAASAAAKWTASQIAPELAPMPMHR